MFYARFESCIIPSGCYCLRDLYIAFSPGEHSTDHRGRVASDGMPEPRSVRDGSLTVFSSEEERLDFPVVYFVDSTGIMSELSSGIQMWLRRLDREP